MWTFTFQFFLSNDLPHTHTHFTIPTTNLGINRKLFKLPNLPPKPPPCPSHHRFTDLNTISAYCPPLFILVFSFSLTSRVRFSSHSYAVPQFTWPSLLPPQCLTRFRASTRSAFCIIYTSHEHFSSCTAIIHSILLDLFTYNFNYSEVQYRIYLWIWLCWWFYLLAMDFFFLCVS